MGWLMGPYTRPIYMEEAVKAIAEADRNPRFQPGDVVELKSGGPRMSVAEHRPDSTMVALVYFLDGKRCNEILPAILLRKPGRI